jgi:HEAT repeat protein
VRVASVDCEIDAGGLKVIWLNGVKGEESVRWLEEMVELRGAVAALGMHRGAGEVETLAGLARKHATSRVRGDALFWLAQRAGEKAVGTITEAIDQDPDTDVKKRAVFALSQLPKDESVRLLIQVARSNRNPVVRKQAFFWLGQSREPAALDFLEEILGTRGKGNAY